MIKDISQSSTFGILRYLYMEGTLYDCSCRALFIACSASTTAIHTPSARILNKKVANQRNILGITAFIFCQKHNVSVFLVCEEFQSFLVDCSSSSNMVKIMLNSLSNYVIAHYHIVDFKSFI